VYKVVVISDGWIKQFVEFKKNSPVVSLASFYLVIDSETCLATVCRCSNRTSLCFFTVSSPISISTQKTSLTPSTRHSARCGSRSSAAATYCRSHTLHRQTLPHAELVKDHHQTRHSNSFPSEF